MTSSVVFLYLFLAAFVLHVAAIWPIPSSYTNGDGVLWIDSTVQISYNGVVQVALPSQRFVFSHILNLFLKQLTGYDRRRLSRDLNDTLKSNEIIATAIESTTKTLFDQQFVPWKFHARNSDFEPDSDAQKVYIKNVALRQNASDPSDILKAAAGTVDESYTLSMTETGSVTITAVSSLGIAHGLKTFTQLFYEHSSGGTYTTLAPVEVVDAPKFQHRGLNMDVARAWYPPKDILRMIDTLAYNKFNRLHLHITDAQSWPLEIPALPELAEKGAYGAGMSYSPATLAHIQEYGAVRGVQTFLEIDMPGHTSSIAHSYPDLIAAYNILPNWDTYAAEPPSGTLKLNSSAVDDFLDTVFEDLLPRVVPYTSYFHTGGDEVNKQAYTLDDTVGSNSTEILQPLMQAFVDKNHARVRAAGMIPIAWEEMLLVWNLTLGSDVVIQTWQSEEAVARTVALGHKALVGSYNFWYLDCGRGQWIDFAPGTSSQLYYPYNDYCNPVHNWRVMYTVDPLHGIPANQTHLVIGGEAHIWSEMSDPVNIDRIVWPRACAAGEVLWSGAKDENGFNRSQLTASPRLSDMRERLVAKGVAAEPVQMPFCTMNGSQCAL